jgi:hypothetical protein
VCMYYEFLGFFRSYFSVKVEEMVILGSQAIDVTTLKPTYTYTYKKKKSTDNSFSRYAANGEGKKKKFKQDNTKNTCVCVCGTTTTHTHLERESEINVQRKRYDSGEFEEKKKAQVSTREEGGKSLEGL